MPNTSCGEDYEKALAAYIAAQEDVVQVDMLHSRMFGNKTYIELELQVDGNLPLREAHAIAERIRNYGPDCKTACDAVLSMHRNISFYYFWRKLWL